MKYYLDTCATSCNVKGIINRTTFSEEIMKGVASYSQIEKTRYRDWLGVSIIQVRVPADLNQPSWLMHVTSRFRSCCKTDARAEWSMPALAARCTIVIFFAPLIVKGGLRRMCVTQYHRDTQLPFRIHVT